SMTRRICFIDDDDKFEIPLFIKAFGGEFEVITAKSFHDCDLQIKSRKAWVPDLFVLDLYFPSELPDIAAVEALRNRPLALAEDKAEVRQAYLNYRLAHDRLRAVLHAWKQSADGGIELAAKVTQKYPKSPIVFYSR